MHINRGVFFKNAGLLVYQRDRHPNSTNSSKYHKLGHLQIRTLLSKCHELYHIPEAISGCRETAHQAVGAGSLADAEALSFFGKCVLQ